MLMKKNNLDRKVKFKLNIEDKINKKKILQEVIKEHEMKQSI
jgi:hypothetical protein